MIKNYLLKFGVVLLWAGFILPQTLSAQQDQAKTAVCPCVGYQSDRCECPQGKKCASCKCDPCTSDEKCVCITAVRAKSGTITGTVSLYRTKAKTKGPKSYKHVVVYLEKVGKNAFPPPDKQPKMDQKGMVFIPHVMAIQKGTTVEFLNNDNDKHNVYFLLEKTDNSKDKPQTKNLGTWKPKESRSHKFEDSGIATMLCKLHLEMAAYMVVLENPFFTVAKIDGKTQKAKYIIKNVPPGKYVLKTWHKKLKQKGGDAEVAVEKGKTTQADLVITKSKYAKKKLVRKGHS